jgi:TRAP-type C4-dicarboxylate transport system substrate-binding protein
MKKTKWAVALLVLMLVVGLASLLVGCGAEKETATTVSPNTTVAGPVTTVAPTTTSAPAPPTTADDGKPIELKFSYPTSTRASLYEAYLLPWANSITAATNNRVTITHYPDNALVKEEQQYDALLSGTADMGLIEMEFTPGVFPVSEVASLPLLFPNAEVAARVFWDIIQQYGQDEFKDVQVLGVTVIAPAQYCGTKPIKMPADFKGLRMRSGGAVETEMIGALGATAVEIGSADLATSMERGMFDGAFLSWSYMKVTGAMDMAKNFTQCDLFRRCWVIAMNKDKWNALPAAVQEAITANSGVEKSVGYVIANDAAGVEDADMIAGKAKGAGSEVVVLTDAEKAAWKEVLAPVYKNWVDTRPAGVPGQEILDKIAELVSKYSAK